MSDDRSPTSVSKQLTVTRSLFYREAYATNFRFRLSPIDFSIVFATNTGNPTAPVQEEAVVSMSIPAAKILTLHLRRMIEEIEHEIGPIKIPKTGIPTEQQMNDLLRSIRQTPLTE
jgi:hypothetical protein